MKKLVVALIALGIFLGVGYLLGSQMGDKEFRFAESAVDLCYANQGYDLGTAPTIPEDVRTQCTQPIRDYENGLTLRLIYAGLAGLVAAGLFLLIAWFLMFRRRETGGTPPPAV